MAPYARYSTRPELHLIVVEANPAMLYDVRTQSEDVCLAAVRQNGYTLQFVKCQTPRVCRAAIERHPDAPRYVNIDIDF